MKKLIVNKSIYNKLLENIENEYLDKEYGKLVYDYLKNGDRYSSEGHINDSKKLVMPFLNYLMKEASPSEKQEFKEGLKNHPKLKDRMKVDWQGRIRCFSKMTSGFEEVSTMKFWKDNQASLYNIFAYDPNFVNLWMRFCQFINSEDGINMLKRNNNLDADVAFMNPQMLKPQWLIHFTNSMNEALGICEHGFKGGIPIDKMSKMAYSKTIPPQEKDGKISYAYNALEISDGFFNATNIDKKDWEFGNSFDQKVWERAMHYAVMFVGNGVEAFHYTDRENQIIFNSDTARDFVLLDFTWYQDKTPHQNDTRNRARRLAGTLCWCVSATDGSVVYSNASITKVVQWVINNFDQYRNKICWSHRKVSESMKKVNITEAQERLLIQENSIDRKVNNTIAQLTGVNDFNEIRRIRAEILNKIPNARAKNCKWLPRIIEMYLEGEIPQQDIKVFNNFLGELHKREHLDGALLDNRFYDFSFDKLKGLYFNDNVIKMQNNATTDKIQKVGNYTIYRIDNQDEANDMAYSIFNGEWCILDDLFDSQVDDCTCYIMKRDDYNNVHEMTVREFNERCPHNTELYAEFRDELDEEDMDIYGNDLMDEFLIDSSTYCSTDDFVKKCGIQPYDDYGYSAIVVLIGPDGKTYGVYSRYNMPNMQDGNFLNTNEISQLLGVVDYRTVMPYVNREETVTESIKIHKGEKGKEHSTQGKWADTIRCPHCDGNAYFSMSISDGNQGRGRIKVTDEQGKEVDSEVQTIALYYCPKCYKFIAQNNMA